MAWLAALGRTGRIVAAAGSQREREKVLEYKRRRFCFWDVWCEITGREICNE
jgi:hypothetical protein